jgi:hypothetical protein
MDATGTIYILLFLVFTVLAILLYWKLDKTWPGGNVVSLIAFGLFVLSFVIPDQDSRELNGLNGFLRINGIIGLLLGVFSYMRHRRTGGSAPEIEARPNPKDRANPNQCPQCGLVNRMIDPSCKRCGTQLQRGT